MLKFIRENAELVKQNVINKNEKADIDKIVGLDAERRSIIQEVEQLKSTRNTVSKEIAQLKKNKEDADDKIAQMKDVSNRIKNLDEQLRTVEETINEMVLFVPNMLNEQVPIGQNEEDNKLVRTWGEANVNADTIDHMAICKELDIIDFERAAKVSGSGFAFYKGKGARLERALLNYFLDFNTGRGYQETFAPFIVNEDAMRGTGQLPKMEEDMYHVQSDGFYLIPTAEVPLTNLHSNEYIDPNKLPVKITGYSPCFRREAGSYGKETRGLLRVHQFNKVELVKLTKPEESYNELESLVGDVEALLQSLDLPYRVLILCSGDTSFASAMTYDLEVYAQGDKNWLEVSSCSNFEAFQAQRAMIRFKPAADAKPEFVHTLNGSGLATPRIMVALLENNYKDGKVIIPEVLRPYTGFDEIG